MHDALLILKLESNTQKTAIENILNNSQLDKYITISPYMNHIVIRNGYHFLFSTGEHDPQKADVPYTPCSLG